VALQGGLIWAASATLTAIPVAGAVWIVTGNVLGAATAGVLWLFCPGPIFFAPWLDQLDTLLVASSFALLLFAQGVRRWPLVWPLLSGVIAGAALFFSYGTAPMLGTALLMSGYRIDAAAGRRTYLRTSLCWLAGLTATLFLPAILGYPVVSSALAAWHAHRDFTLTRHQATWLVYNPLDFAMMFGGVSMVMMIATLMKGPRRAAAWRLTACAVCAVLLIDLSGTARGEVGRLWMPFMPLLFAAVWSAPAWSAEKHTASSLDSWDSVVLGAMMMLYCVTLRQHWIAW
jgi:hypothetical protein